MNTIFCPSYHALFFALYLKYQSKEEISIITYNESVRAFCKEAKIKCHFFELPELGLGFSTLFSNIYKLQKLKKNIKQLLKSLDIKKDTPFFFLDSYIAYAGFYLAKIWAKQGKVFYQKSDEKLNKFSSKSKYSLLYILRSKLYFHTLRLVLGIKIVLYDGWGAKLVPGIDSAFLKHHHIQPIKLGKSINELRSEAVHYRIPNIASYGKCENLLISSYPPILASVTEESLVKLYKELREIPFSMRVKAHPIVSGTEEGSKKFKELMGTDDILPHHIPVELLLNSVQKNVIAVCSMALVAAAEIKGLKAIALLELIDWKAQERKDNFKALLQEKSNNKIIFVKDFEELRKLLTD